MPWVITKLVAKLWYCIQYWDGTRGLHEANLRTECELSKRILVYFVVWDSTYLVKSAVAFFPVKRWRNSGRLNMLAPCWKIVYGIFLNSESCKRNKQELYIHNNSNHLGSVNRKSSSGSTHVQQLTCFLSERSIVSLFHWDCISPSLEGGEQMSFVQI